MTDRLMSLAPTISTASAPVKDLTCGTLVLHAAVTAIGAVGGGRNGRFCMGVPIANCISRRRPQADRPGQVDEAYALKAGGRSVRAIAAELGISVGSMHEIKALAEAK